MGAPPQPPQGDIGLQPGDSTVTMDWQRRNLKVVPVFELEIRALIAGYTSTFFGLFGIFAGLGLSSLTTYLTVSLTDSLSLKYFCATLLFLCLAFIFFILSIKEWLRSKATARDLLRRESTIPRTAND